MTECFSFYLHGIPCPTKSKEWIPRWDLIAIQSIEHTRLPPTTPSIMSKTLHYNPNITNTMLRVYWGTEIALAAWRPVCSKDAIQDHITLLCYCEWTWYPYYHPNPPPHLYCGCAVSRTWLSVMHWCEVRVNVPTFYSSYDVPLSPFLGKVKHVSLLPHMAWRSVCLGARGESTVLCVGVCKS